MLTISGLYVYPVKSLGGIALNEALVTDRGFQYDRRWMLVDDQHRFLSQREVGSMALLKVSLHNEGLLIKNGRSAGTQLLIPYQSDNSHTISVTIWNDRCEAQWVNPMADAWFTEQLGLPCKLVYMPNGTRREVDHTYAHQQEITSFSDAFPILMIGQASLDDLNSRLSLPLPMNRFRPNIVFTGGLPFQEDHMPHFTVGDIDFFAVKPCARCVVTTIDQQTGERAKEPLQTLATYRSWQNKIHFGQNLLFKGQGTVRVGDRITIINSA